MRVTAIDEPKKLFMFRPACGNLAWYVEAMCAFANSDGAEGPFIHPVVRAIVVHLWLAYDHPFVDGNGRTARVLFYWSMLRQGYWLTEFISISRAIQESRAQYDRAFEYSETDSNDATYFVLNQLKVLRVAIDALFAHLKRKAREVRSVDEQIRQRDDLNPRQLQLLSYLLRHPDARITIESHQLSHRVVYQTARTDLLGLAKGGYVEQTKSGKKLVFVPVRQLPRKLCKPKESRPLPGRIALADRVAATRRGWRRALRSATQHVALIRGRASVRRNLLIVVASCARA